MKRSLWLLLFVGISGVAMAGCGLAATGATAMAAVVILAIGMAGCIVTRETVGADAGGGSFEQCCQNGRTASCYCPPRTACNFGMAVDFRPDGTCSLVGQGGQDGGPLDAGTIRDGGAPDAGGRDAGATDAGVRDAGEGTWEQCCQNGHTATCYCPPHTACNYGMATTFCPDGTCRNEPGGLCGDTDAGTVDAGEPDAGQGTWPLCCDNGKLSTCYCPPMTACNYFYGNLCGEGACSFDAIACTYPSDAGGRWNPCCVEGKVTSCFCDARIPCNYAPYELGPGGTCTMVGP